MYEGESAFSEIETKGLLELSETLKNRLVLFIDFHCCIGGKPFIMVVFYFYKH